MGKPATAFQDLSRVKIYPALELLLLPREVRRTDVPALSAIAETAHPNHAVPDLSALSQLLYLSAGITRRRTSPGGEIYFRAAATTGALYEIELYLACGHLQDLEAGLYHFAAGEFGLRMLRAGDYRGVLVEATAAEPSILHAPVIVICTGTYWRNAWKYQGRTYRHFGWDNGTLLANLLAMSTALNLPAKVVCGFADAEVNRLLDVETEREVAFSLVSIGHVAELPPPPSKEILSLKLETVPLSRKEVDYPAMREIHAASSLLSPEEVAAWRGNTPPSDAAEPLGELIPLQPLGDAEIPRDPVQRVILRRGSTRQFAREPITFLQLSTMLDRATRGVPADFLQPFLWKLLTRSRARVAAASCLPVTPAIGRNGATIPLTSYAMLVDSLHRCAASVASTGRAWPGSVPPGCLDRGLRRSSARSPRPVT